MEEEVRGEIDSSSNWKAFLWKKRRLILIKEAFPTIIIGALLVALFTYVFMHQIDRFSYGSQVVPEARPEFVKREFACLILEPYDTFRLSFYHPNLRIWNFSYRPRHLHSFEAVAKHSGSQGWTVTQKNKLELHLEKKTENRRKLISRIYLRKSANCFDMWVANVSAAEDASHLWQRVDTFLSATSQARSTY